MPTVDPTPVAFAAPGVVFAKPEIKAPTKAWKTPPNNTKMPPIKARTNAAVGFSAN
jgi:hypothetical protein